MSFDFEHLKKLCLCNRDTKGFDYGEIHPTLGKCGAGQRWSSTQDNFELLKNKFIKLESELARSKSENEMMREALEFYGSFRSYSTDYDPHSEMSRWCILYGDQEEQNQSTTYSGRRARECLAKLSKVEE